MTIKFTIYNDVDLPNKLFQGGFKEYVYLEDVHMPQLAFKGLKSEIAEIENEGVKLIEKITSWREWELTFIREQTFALFISELKLHSNFEILFDEKEVIPDEWDVEIADITNQIDFRKIKIIYKTDFQTKTNKNTNYELDDAVNIAPIAENVYISGQNTVASQVTGNYTYSDVDGDLEGTSLFRWFRADDAQGTNKQLITGENFQTYIIANADLNKYLFFQVKPIALTGETDGIYTESSPFGSDTNTAPVAASVLMVGTGIVGTTLTGSYVYSDADGDLEDTSTLIFSRSEDFDGLNKTTIQIGSLTYDPTTSDVGYWINFEVIPIALTGIKTGNLVIGEDTRHIKPQP